MQNNMKRKNDMNKNIQFVYIELMNEYREKMTKKEKEEDMRDSLMFHYGII